MKNLKENIRVILTPSCWLQNHQYSSIWDTILLQAMSKHKFKRKSDYTVFLGDLTLWIANHPYASFVPAENDCGIRASRKTILKAHDKLVSDLYEQQHESTIQTNNQKNESSCDQ